MSESPTSSPPASDADAGASADAAGPLSAGPALDAADIAALLDASQHGTWAENSDAALDMSQGYDGHVALALDASAMADVDLTLDLLTSSHQLFDVPALDVGTFDDASPV
jgi:hypothetical protein